MALALITGAYGGLGNALSIVHARTGGDLILVGRSQDKLDAQAATLRQAYRIKVHTIAVDLSQEDAAYTIFDICSQENLLPDYLINNAGFGGQGDFARDRSLEADMSMIAVNIETPTRLLKLFLPEMIQRGSGKVLNVSSIAALAPGPLQAVYFATKAYVTSWSNALAKELAGTGVSVSCFMPGAMETGFAQTSGLDDTDLFKNAVSPDKAAQEAYNEMLNGKINIFAAVRTWQKPLLPLISILPRKRVLDYIYRLQKRH
ncbi:SDR family NAD(P)-dependent oxidoreductase [Corynebacterium kutscheri]|uniref:SDR family NAD(P)-dependent oxidoreductase n=1 Tax=Corynebacterium kutscheri TaxID=35755 RepID=UPI0037BED92A